MLIRLSTEYLDTDGHECLCEVGPTTSENTYGDM